MRFINMPPPPDAGWNIRATLATTELLSKTTAEERKTYIEAHQKIWQDAKQYLLPLSFHKCWYTEAKDIVSDWHVDHFRPKNKAIGLSARQVYHEDGYWWLAFEWTNYRIAGSFANSPHREDGELRGKAGFFPLDDVSPICSCRDDMHVERCCLLDPTVEDDVRLITFDEEGKVAAACDAGTWEYKRVLISKQIYNLDHGALKAARKKIWEDCQEFINYIVNASDPQNMNPGVISIATRQIEKLLNPESQLSSVARACLLQSGYKFAEELVNPGST